MLMHEKTCVIPITIGFIIMTVYLYTVLYSCLYLVVNNIRISDVIVPKQYSAHYHNVYSHLISTFL